jgi:ketosteroid isomerase-like protein
VAQTNPTNPAVVAVDQVLTELHDAASKADFDRYFNLYTDDAIFLGTDATERWTIDEFKDYARPSFTAGRGWTYVKKTRNIYISADGNSAWFDETLENQNLGDTRGTGALVKVGDTWKLAQYNLTIPIPNDVAREFVGIIRKFDDRGRSEQ